MGDVVLLEVSDFEVRKVDGDDGKKYFDRVSRYKCYSALSDMEMEIDINTDLYPLAMGEFSADLTGFHAAARAPGKGHLAALRDRKPVADLHLDLPIQGTTSSWHWHQHLIRGAGQTTACTARTSYP